MDPLKPTVALLSKLGSIIVHAREFAGPDGHPFDSITLLELIRDPEVREWIRAMDAMALIPLERKG